MNRVERYIKRQYRQTRRKIVKTRPTTHIIRKTYRDKPIVGCEVGVFKADNAVNMLKNLPNLTRLYLVDPYKEYEGYVPFGPRVDNVMLLDALLIAERRLKPHKDRVTLIVDQFTASIIPEPLDFIYIDGNHDYEYVKHDILEAEKIVKKGGLISGHDYYPEGTHNIEGVGKAVRERYGGLFSNREEDWWVIKQ